jgi:hypothetical protein
MQPRPGANPHHAVLPVVGDVLRGWCGPRRRILAGNLRAVLARSTTLGRRRRGWWVGVKAAVGAHADEDGTRARLQPLCSLRGVVARIEDEQRGCTPGWKAAEQVFDLVHRNGVCVLTRMHALAVEGRAPTVPREAELGQPLIRPAGHNRLSGRVARGMVVVAARWTGLGVAPQPDAPVNRVDYRTRTIVGGVLCQQYLQGRHVESAFSERIVKAAPAATVCRLQTEVRQ